MINKKILIILLVLFLLANQFEWLTPEPTTAPKENYSTLLKRCKTNYNAAKATCRATINRSDKEVEKLCNKAIDNN